MVQIDLSMGGIYMAVSSLESFELAFSAKPVSSSRSLSPSKMHFSVLLHDNIHGTMIICRLVNGADTTAIELERRIREDKEHPGNENEQ